MARQSTAEEIQTGLAEADSRADSFQSPTVPLIGVINGLALSILLWYAIGLAVALLAA